MHEWILISVDFISMVTYRSCIKFFSRDYSADEMVDISTRSIDWCVDPVATSHVIIREAEIQDDLRIDKFYPIN